MIKIPGHIDFQEASIEERYHGTVRGLQARIRDLYSEIVERFGQDGLQLIRSVSGQYGDSLGKHIYSRQGASSIQDVAKFLVKVFNNVLAEGEISEWSNERITIKVTRCPYPLTDPSICAAHTTMEEALVKNLNPDLDYHIEKCIPRGDQECWHVIKRKRVKTPAENVAE